MFGPQRQNNTADNLLRNQGNSIDTEGITGQLSTGEQGGGAGLDGSRESGVQQTGGDGEVQR